jgi:hypothetical protein
MIRAPSLERVRRSRFLGALGVLVFIASAVVFPLSHAIHHQHDHEHGVAGVLAQAFGAFHHHHHHPHAHPHPARGHEHGGNPWVTHGHADDHEHADSWHDGPERGDDDKDGDGGDRHDRRRSDPNHGHGSLEHLGVALLGAGIVLVPPSFRAPDRLPLPRDESTPVTLATWSPRQPRAPPA